MSSPRSVSRLPRLAWLLVGVIASLQIAACPLGSLRADDWVNLERGQLALSSQWSTIWTTLNPFTLYRPLVDVWHGLMSAAFGQQVGLMLVMLVCQLLLQTWLLSRLVRNLGGSRETAALVALAMWSQANTYTWTTLWISNATGSLMTTFTLLALLALTRAARLGAAGRAPHASLAMMLLAYIAAILCKEESVLLPGIAAALAAMRWSQARGGERRVWMAGVGALLAIGVCYAIFRTVILATPQVVGNRYHLSLGIHVLRNLLFFTVHLGVLPASAAVICWVLFPNAFHPQARGLPEWAMTRRAMLAGWAWSAVAILLYLPISGRSAFGYLYAPAFGIAFAVGHGVMFAARAQATIARRASPLTPLVGHAMLAVSLTAAGLAMNQWHRFGAIQREALDTLRVIVPEPHPGATFIFLDPGIPETPSGRSLFSLVFEGATTSMLHLTYQRTDIKSQYLRADALLPQSLPAEAIVFSSRMGRLIPQTP